VQFAACKQAVKVFFVNINKVFLLSISLLCSFEIRVLLSVLASYNRADMTSLLPAPMKKKVLLWSNRTYQAQPCNY